MLTYIETGHYFEFTHLKEMPLVKQPINPMKIEALMGEF